MLTATSRLLVDEGLAACSMEAVAQRAGVGKAAIYRRWPNSRALVVDALARLTEAPAPVLGGTSVRDDLVALLDTAAQHMSHAVGRLLPTLVGEAAADPDLGVLFYDRVIRPRRRRFLEVLARGQDRGEVATEADLDLVVDLMVGPLVYRLVVLPGARPAPTRQDFEHIVDVVLLGLQPRGATPS